MAGRIALAALALRPAFFGLGLAASAALSRILKRKEEDLRRMRYEGEGNSEFTDRLDAAARMVNGTLRYMAVRTGRIPSHAVRMFLYRKVFLLGAEKDVVVHHGAEIRAAYKIRIGEGSIIGDEAKLDGRRGIDIGRHVNLSTGVWIWTLDHDPQSPNFSSRGRGGRVTIGDRAWLSAGAVVLPGSAIGEGAVVAAGSVVTGDLEPYSINAGVPARKVGERNRDLAYSFDGSHQPFL
ncbi:MAG: acyltransferase [Actinomycetota bacterium]|nr:acyltransferase [Actinomycetota bacterium]